MLFNCLGLFIVCERLRVEYVCQGPFIYPQLETLEGTTNKYKEVRSLWKKTVATFQITRRQHLQFEHGVIWALSYVRYINLI